MAKIAFVTGSSEPLSLGYAIARQLAPTHRVFMTARSEENGRAAVAQLRKDVPSADVDVCILDLTSQSDIEAAVKKVGPRLDVLVNNAALRVAPAKMDAFRAKAEAASSDKIPLNVGASMVSANQLLELTTNDLLEQMRFNVGAPLQLVNAFWPALLASDAPRIVNVSSGRGSISFQSKMTAKTQGIIPYSISKAALNMLTVSQSINLTKHKPNAKVNACCPSNARTKVNPTGTLSLDEGAAVATWLATLPDDGVTATFWQARTKAEVGRDGFLRLDW